MKNFVINLYKNYSKRFEPWNCEIDDVFPDTKLDLTVIDDYIGSQVYLLEIDENIDKVVIREYYLEISGVINSLSSDTYSKEQKLVFANLLFLALICEILLEV